MPCLPVLGSALPREPSSAPDVRASIPPALATERRRRLARRLIGLTVISMLGLGLAAAPVKLSSRVVDDADFVHFESAHVHPITITPDGTRLLVVNTPDNRLSVFDLSGAAPTRVAEIPVGLEPVSVAAVDDGEAWVVNHLSDDVSVVDLTTLHVRATLHVGDEPSDVVVAGATPRVYVSVSQEDAIRVYDPRTLERVAVVAIEGRMPSALASGAAGARVYVAILNGGNRTSVLSPQEVGPAGAPPPDPPLRAGLPPAPDVGLIVQQQGGRWVDEAGRVWNSDLNPTGQAQIQYELLDTDLVEIDTATQQVVRMFSDIGAVNLALAASPAPGGRIAMTATEARNLTRFEPRLRGRVVETRLALLSPGLGGPLIIDLNREIDYSVVPGPASDRDLAVGNPTGVAWSGDGARVYVTALANDRVAELNLASGAVSRRAPTVAGPTGILVDDARGRIYVVGRFRNELQTLSASDLSQIAVASIGFDPTPDPIVNGRKFFYGGFTSGHGEQACATCHLFGDTDQLAWDLGDPQGNMQPIDRSRQLDPRIEAEVHPMKGPMMTLTLRGLRGTGPLHTRGDRSDLRAFNPLFTNLLGRSAQLPDSEMAALESFLVPLVHPPNPHQLLNRGLRAAPLHQPSPARGWNTFFNHPTPCTSCHTTLNVGGAPGTNGQIVNKEALRSAQDLKVPHLRSLYRKTGFHDQTGAVSKRGFGFGHDGSVGDLFTFLDSPRFDDTRFASPTTQTPEENRRDLEAFLLCIDTGLSPAVGAQVTLDRPDMQEATVLRLDTLEVQARTANCDLVAKGRLAGRPRGWMFLGNGLWRSDKRGERPVTTAGLRALAGSGSEITFTGVPAGSGARMGIDRDRDGYLDGDERDAGSDPGNPVSTPHHLAAWEASEGFALRPNPFRSATELSFTLSQAGPIDCEIFDLLGRRVATMARGLWLPPGPQRLTWQGRRDGGAPAGAGVYFVRLDTRERHWTGTLVKVH